MEQNLAFQTKELDCDGLFQRMSEPRVWTTVFRGMEDSEWELVPYAYRDEGKAILKAMTKACINGPMSLVGIDKAKLDQIYYEIIPLIWFWDTANRRGLRVPDIPHHHRGDAFFEADGLIKETIRKSDFSDWLEIAALAQHYGIPTRLLDWSYDMETAIFFATRNISEEQIILYPDRCFSIWEMIKPMTFSVNDAIRLVVPDYCDNPNIRAQCGLFSTIITGNPGERFDKFVEESVNHMDAGMRSLLYENKIPVLFRIDVKYSEVPRIKQILENRGSSHDRYHPSLLDVVESMKIQSGLTGSCCRKGIYNDVKLGISLFNHPNMISTIMYLHDNPECTMVSTPKNIRCFDSNVKVLVESELATKKSNAIRLTPKGEDVASHLLTIERLMETR